MENQTVKASPTSLIEAEAARQKTRLLYQDARTAIAANALNAALLAYVNTTLGSSGRDAFYWAALIAVIAIGRFILVMRYRNAFPDGAAERRWRQYFIGGTVISALGWGFGTVLFMWQAPETIYLFTGIVVAGTVAGGVPTLGPVLIAYRLYATLILAPMASVILLQAEGALDWTFGVLTLFFLGMLLKGARSLHDTVDVAIRLRLEQESLATNLNQARLEAENALAEQTRTESDLRASEERYQLILQHSPTGIIHYDRNLKITYCNDRFAEILHTPRAKLMGLDMKQLKDTRVLPGLKKALDGEIGTYEGEYVSTLSNTHIYISMSCSPMISTGGKNQGGIAIVEDISDRKQIEEQLKHLAQIDPLTDLYNRRHFMEIADKEFARTLRYGTDLTVLMLDLDHFKKINDTYGHRVGDEALIRFSELCRNCLRRHDIIGRLGGEEFAVLLPHTASEQGWVVAEKLRALIEDTTLPLDGGASLQFTVSIGLASLGKDTSSLDVLINHADTALYNAKDSGRNRICEASPGSSS